LQENEKPGDRCTGRYFCTAPLKMLITPKTAKALFTTPENCFKFLPELKLCDRFKYYL
jgi:hypothetical protein